MNILASSSQAVSLVALNEKIGCYFTVETYGRGKTPLRNFDIHAKRFDSKIASIPQLVSALQKEWKEVDIAYDMAVIHIVARPLIHDPTYALNARVNVQYAGFLGYGRDPDAGTIGLVPYLQKQVPSLALKTEGTITGIFNDAETRTQINATNAIVRDVLTKAVPLKGYSVVLWRAETKHGIAGLESVVQFYGPQTLPSSGKP